MHFILIVRIIKLIKQNQKNKCDSFIISKSGYICSHEI